MSKLKRSFINMIMGGALYIVPILLNLIFTPLLLRQLGEAAYGLQALGNIVILYFMVTDLGLDIIVVKFISEFNAKKDHATLNKIFNTTFQYYCLIGVAGMLIIGLFSDVFVYRLFNIPPELHREAKNVFLLTGIGFAGSVVSIWGRGVCIGFQRYDIANGINIINNIFSNVVGVMAVMYGYGVVGYVAVRVTCAFLSACAYIYFSQNLVPAYKFNFGFDSFVWGLLKSQVGYGFILRISGMWILGLDRTFIGAWLGVGAVSIYAIPYLIASSFSLLIQSTMHFIFPMTSELHSTNKHEELLSLFLRGAKFIVLLSTLLFLPLLLFGDKFLSLWLGAG